MITRMDRDIGRLTTRLGELGIDERTLVMFVSDNGPHQEGGGDPVFFKSAGGLRGIKRDLYEGGIRVPMIARWRGTIPAGRVSDHVWAHWDMLPTLAELAGAKTPAALDGLSMTRALERPAAADARLPVLGVPRARLPAGRAHGTLEGASGWPRLPRSSSTTWRTTRTKRTTWPPAIATWSPGSNGTLGSARTESARWPVK